MKVVDTAFTDFKVSTLLQATDLNHVSTVIWNPFRNAYILSNLLPLKCDIKLQKPLAGATVREHWSVHATFQQHKPSLNPSLGLQFSAVDFLTAAAPTNLTPAVAASLYEDRRQTLQAAKMILQNGLSVNQRSLKIKVCAICIFTLVHNVNILLEFVCAFINLQGF